MQCTLYIPCLMPPREPGTALWRTVDAPDLKLLLARAGYKRTAPTDAAALLCQLFGVAPQQDSPLAPLLAAAAGLDASNGYWLCATPIHLETRRNALLLTDPAALALSTSESAALTDTLAQHLRDENVTLHAPRPHQWFVRSDTPPVMTTCSLDAVTGHDIGNFLPQGQDSRRWHRILTEMQMLLHAHPVNEAREASGHIAANSVWLWAGGSLPAVPQAATYITAWSNDTVTCALAHHTGSRTRPAPARITPDTLDEGSHFFSTDLLVAPMRQGDLQAWSAAVTALDRDWFNPLLAALKARRVRQLTLISNDNAGTHTFTGHPRDLMKFWRKNKYLQ